VSLVRVLDLAQASAAPRRAIPAGPAAVRERGGGVARSRPRRHEGLRDATSKAVASGRRRTRAISIPALAARGTSPHGSRCGDGEENSPGSGGASTASMPPAPMCSTLPSDIEFSTGVYTSMNLQ